MGKPGAAKGGRKAKTAELRPRYADADADLNDADDFIEALRDIDDTHRLFVETYFNLRHIGAGGQRRRRRHEQSRPRNKTYFAWAKVVSIVGAVAALGWGAVQSMILYHRMMRHTLAQFKADRLPLAILSLGCIFAIASSRAYKTAHEDTEPT